MIRYALLACPRVSVAQWLGLAILKGSARGGWCCCRAATRSALLQSGLSEQQERVSCSSCHPLTAPNPQSHEMCLISGTFAYWGGDVQHSARHVHKDTDPRSLVTVRWPDIDCGTSRFVEVLLIRKCIGCAGQPIKSFLADFFMLPFTRCDSTLCLRCKT